MLEVKNLKKHYPIGSFFGKKGVVRAVDGISFNLGKKKTLAVVGESGCGKSTLAKLLMQIEPLTDGSIIINNKNAAELSKKEYVKTLQMVFQDPYSSINPRLKAWKIIVEPLLIHESYSNAELREKALDIMEKVGLRPEHADRYPHMFSGGQRQRIGIARALIYQPKILICDEPVSALDVSIQAQVLNMLMDVQDQLELSYLFISHDLSVVKHIADEVLVMYLGKVVEQGSRTEIFKKPLHPYTQALLASSPHEALSGEQKAKSLEGELPSPLNPPSGCPLHKRCPYVMDKCKIVVPELKQTGNTLVACHLH